MYIFSCSFQIWKLFQSYINIELLLKHIKTSETEWDLIWLPINFFTGRTGVIIACYLVFTNRIHADDAIQFVRSKRLDYLCYLHLVATSVLPSVRIKGFVADILSYYILYCIITCNNKIQVKHNFDNDASYHYWVMPLEKCSKYQKYSFSDVEFDFILHKPFFFQW
jgi:hypothetical protein